MFLCFCSFVRMDKLTTMKKIFLTTFFLLKGCMYIYETRTPKHNKVEYELCTRKGRNGIVGKIFPDQRLVDFLGVIIS